MATGFTSGLRGNADITSISELASSPAQAPPDAINSKPAMLDNARHLIRGPSGSTGFGQTRAKLGPTQVNTNRRELSKASLREGSRAKRGDLDRPVGRNESACGRVLDNREARQFLFGSIPGRIHFGSLAIIEIGAPKVAHILARHGPVEISPFRM
jgi:hypothetical protein